jgi:16S rRNA (uracil1498-N3)-methyltransferase
MHRFFTTEIQNGTATVRGEDVKHITKVLRLRAGDCVQLCDGKGNECDAVIASVLPDAVTFDTQPWQRAKTESETRITLFQCLPKAGKMETIIQKCVELGASSFVPVQSERCVVVLKPPYEGRIERWQRVSEEAAKQSRRGIVPVVALPEPLKSLDFSAFDTVLVAYENERTVSLKQALRSGAHKTIAIVIGPEGGFAEEEIAKAEELGMKKITLGRRILRTETAGMTMLSILMYMLEAR